MRDHRIDPPSVGTLDEFEAGDEKVAITAAPLAAGFFWHEPSTDPAAHHAIQFITETELFASTPQARRRRKQEQVTEVDALIARYRTTYDQVAAEVARVAGVNLLDPGQWAGVGLDASGPMGAAMVDLRCETVVGFVSLSDREVFRGFLERTSKGQLAPVLEDRGLVLKTEPDSSSAVVLRVRYAFFVSTGRPNRAAYDHARALATIDPARGLTGTPRWQQATASGEPPRPLTAYVDVWGLLEAEFGSLMAREREPSWALQELERAQVNGAPQEDLTRQRQQVDEERRYEEQRRVREQVKGCLERHCGLGAGLGRAL